MTLKTIALLVALGWTASPVGAEIAQTTLPAEQNKPLYLAMAHAPGMDLGQLNHFFDATNLRLKEMSAPKPASASIKAASSGKKTGAKADMKRSDFFPKWPSRSKVNVPPPPAYRRTFKRLLAQPETTDRYDDLILKYARAYRLDARLLKAVIAAESEFFRGAVSPRGARGLMQVMPATAEEMGIASSRLHEPSDNIRAGAAYLATLFQAAWKKYKLKGVRFQDAPLWLKQRIIASYNAGPKFLFGAKEWYTQTRHYVKKVILFYHSPVTDFHRAPKALNAYPPIAFSLSPVTLY